MLIQSVLLAELLVAYVTLPVGPVESICSGRIMYTIFLGPLDLLVGDSTIPVTVANHAEDSFAVQLRRSRTGTSF